MSDLPPNDILYLSPRVKLDEPPFEYIASLKDTWRGTGFHDFYIDTTINRFVDVTRSFFGFGKIHLEYDNWWIYHLKLAIDNERRRNPHGFSERHHMLYMNKINRCKLI